MVEGLEVIWVSIHHQEDGWLKGGRNPPQRRYMLRESNDLQSKFFGLITSMGLKIHEQTKQHYLFSKYPNLLSHFSCVRLCDPIDSRPPGSLSLGFSRQEHWSGLPFPSPNNPMDCSLPGSSIHGIFQARVLEWGAIAFSKYIFSKYT